MSPKQAYKIWCNNIQALLRNHILGVGSIFIVHVVVVVVVVAAAADDACSVM